MQLVAHRVGEIGRGTFLYYFLVTALARAITLSQGQCLARAVTEHLYFYVPGAGDEFFQEHAVVGKVAGAEALDAVESAVQFFQAVAQLHTDAAAAGGTLQHDGIADALGCLLCGAQVLQ